MVNTPSISKKVLENLDYKQGILFGLGKEPKMKLAFRDNLSLHHIHECLNNSLVVDTENDFFYSPRDKEYEKDLKNLEDAFRFLYSLDINEFNREFERYIKKVNSLILGNPTSSDYRNIDIEFNREVCGEEIVSKPKWEDVEKYISELSEMLRLYRPNPVLINGAYILARKKNLNNKLRRVTYKNSMHPVEYAAFLQQNLTWIHPFEDGNGRTSRLVSNFYLNKFNFPCANITAGERLYYFSLLKEGDIGIIEDNPKRGNPFAEYLASKVSVSLEECIRRLK